MIDAQSRQRHGNPLQCVNVVPHSDGISVSVGLPGGRASGYWWNRSDSGALGISLVIRCIVPRKR